MASITFPNVANALLPLMQMDRQAERDKWQMDRAAKHDELMLQDRKEARALTQMQLMDRLDTSQRAKLKEAAEVTTQAALGVLNAPEAERPAAYQQALNFLKSRGHDTGNLPQQYSPGMDGMLKFYVQKAEPISEYFKRQAEMPQPMGASGAAAPQGAPAPGGMPSYAAAIAKNESGGKYDAVGPVANSKGQRAYGKYQVMDFNIGPWTQEVLGQPMSPQEFLANPQAQDAVFNAKFGQLVQKYGPDGASRAWFAGEGGMNNPGATDVLGTSVAEYSRRFNAGLGGPQVAQAGGAPVVPQGDAVAGQGDVPPSAADPLAAVRGVQLPPGARIMAQKGIPIVKDGAVMILKADGTPDFVPLPQRAEPRVRQAPAGYDFVPGGGLAPIPGGPADPTVQRRERIPIGYRGTPDGGLEPIPGGPADPARKPAATPKEMQDLRTARTEAAALVSALEDFQSASKSASTMESVKSVAGMNTPLNTAYNAAALLAKGEQLFNLGVLNGPDLDIIRRTLPDPSTLRGAGASSQDMDAAVKKIVDLIQMRVAAREDQLGLPVTDVRGLARDLKANAPQGDGQAKPPKPADSKPQSFQEGATATNPSTGEKLIYRNGQWSPLR